MFELNRSVFKRPLNEERCRRGWRGSWITHLNAHDAAAFYSG